MKTHLRVSAQELLDSLRFVRREIIQDNVDFTRLPAVATTSSIKSTNDLATAATLPLIARRTLSRQCRRTMLHQIINTVPRFFALRRSISHCFLQQRLQARDALFERTNLLFLQIDHFGF